MMHHLRSPLLPFLAIVILAGCETPQPEESGVREPDPVLIGGPDQFRADRPPADFAEFSARTRRGDYETSVDEDRYDLLREAAVSYAAQAGYQHRVWEVMRQLEQDSAKLSRTFDFNRVSYRARGGRDISSRPS